MALENDPLTINIDVPAAGSGAGQSPELFPKQHEEFRQRTETQWNNFLQDQAKLFRAQFDAIVQRASKGAVPSGQKVSESLSTLQDIFGVVAGRTQQFGSEGQQKASERLRTFWEDVRTRPGGQLPQASTMGGQAATVTMNVDAGVESSLADLVAAIEGLAKEHEKTNEDVKSGRGGRGGAGGGGSAGDGGDQSWANQLFGAVMDPRLIALQLGRMVTRGSIEASGVRGIFQEYNKVFADVQREEAEKEATFGGLDGLFSKQTKRFFGRVGEGAVPGLKQFEDAAFKAINEFLGIRFQDDRQAMYDRLGIGDDKRGQWALNEWMSGNPIRMGWAAVNQGGFQPGDKSFFGRKFSTISGLGPAGFTLDRLLNLPGVTRTKKQIEEETARMEGGNLAESERLRQIDVMRGKANKADEFRGEKSLIPGLIFPKVPGEERGGQPANLDEVARFLQDTEDHFAGNKVQVTPIYIPQYRDMA